MLSLLSMLVGVAIVVVPCTGTLNCRHNVYAPPRSCNLHQMQWKPFDLTSSYLLHYQSPRVKSASWQLTANDTRRSLLDLSTFSTTILCTPLGTGVVVDCFGSYCSKKLSVVDCSATNAVAKRGSRVL